MNHIVLRALSGARADSDERIPYEDGTVVLIGTSEEAAYRFDKSDKAVQPKHCTITVSDEGRTFLLAPVGMTPTSLNKRLLYEPVKLYPGDTIQVGAGGPELNFSIDPPLDQVLDVSPKNKSRFLTLVALCCVAAIMFFSIYGYLMNKSFKFGEIESEPEPIAAAVPTALPVEPKYSTAFLECVWNMQKSAGGALLYHKHEQTPLGALPVFIRRNDQSLQPLLSDMDDGGLNVQVSALTRTIGFFIDERGALLTSSLLVDPSSQPYPISLDRGIRTYAEACYGTEKCRPRDIPEEKLSGDRSASRWILKEPAFIGSGARLQTIQISAGARLVIEEPCKARFPGSDKSADIKLEKIHPTLDVAHVRISGLDGKVALLPLNMEELEKASLLGSEINVLSFPSVTVDIQAAKSAREGSSAALSEPQKNPGRLTEILRPGGFKSAGDDRRLYLVRMYSKSRLAQGGPVLSAEGKVLGIYTQSPWATDEAIVVPIEQVITRGNS